MQDIEHNIKERGRQMNRRPLFKCINYVWAIDYLVPTQLAYRIARSKPQKESSA